MLRNRGYSLSSDEDELKQRLQELEKGLQDPAMSARMEELWSRLIIIRGYAESLKNELLKQGLNNEGLGEEVEAKAKKVSSGVSRAHLSMFRLTRVSRSWRTTRNSSST